METFFPRNWSVSSPNLRVTSADILWQYDLLRYIYEFLGQSTFESRSRACHVHAIDRFRHDVIFAIPINISEGTIFWRQRLAVTWPPQKNCKNSCYCSGGHGHCDHFACICHGPEQPLRGSPVPRGGQHAIERQ